MIRLINIFHSRMILSSNEYQTALFHSFQFYAKIDIHLACFINFIFKFHHNLDRNRLWSIKEVVNWTLVPYSGMISVLPSFLIGNILFVHNHFPFVQKSIRYDSREVLVTSDTELWYSSAQVHILENFRLWWHFKNENHIFLEMMSCVERPISPQNLPLWHFFEQGFSIDDCWMTKPLRIPFESLTNDILFSVQSMSNPFLNSNPNLTSWLLWTHHWWHDESVNAQNSAETFLDRSLHLSIRLFGRFSYPSATLKELVVAASRYVLSLNYSGIFNFPRQHDVFLLQN